MLPLYQRIGSSSTQIKLKSSIRIREKILIFLVLLTFGFVCFGGFFFLPDNFSSDSVRQVYNKFKKHSPEIFIPAPPVEKHRDFDIDRIKLQQKIANDFNDDEILEKPELERNQHHNSHQNNIPIVPPPEQHNQNEINDKPPTISATSESLVYNVDGEDSDKTAQERRNKVKEVSAHICSYFKHNFPRYNCVISEHTTGLISVHLITSTSRFTQI